MEPRIACPYCGERNVVGSNICGGCLRPIREYANPDREDMVTTQKTKRPALGEEGLWPRLKRWWQKRFSRKA